MEEIEYMRRLDDLGRIVIPADFRHALLLGENDRVSLTLDGAAHSVTIRRYAPSCVCCHTTEHLRQLPGEIYVCDSCLAKLS